MKRALFIIVSLILFYESNSQVMWEFKKDTVITWYFSEGDEFNGNAINLDYWKYIGSSRSLFANNEQEYYTDGENHFVNNGSLKLTAKKDSVFKRTIDWMNDNDSLFAGKKFYSLNKRNFNYTAGKLISQNTFNKGFFECRFKIPTQKGYWPAFWLYGGSPNEEIDMMECKSERPNQVHVDTHCGDKCDYVDLLFKDKSYGGWVKTRYDFTEGYNIIGCHWDENEVRFYANGECVGVSKVKFDIEKYLAMNIAVPGNNGPFHPGPSEKDTSTATFEIDYVRVWKQDSKEFVRSSGEIPYTEIDTLKSIVSSSKIKTKHKLVYGKKSDHKDDGVFVSFFQGDSTIQVYALGAFGKERPVCRITSIGGKEILTQKVDKQIYTIPVHNFLKGMYIITIEWQNRKVKKNFSLK